MGKTKISLGRILIVTALIIVGIFSLGAVGALGAETLIKGWIPFVIAMGLALVSGVTLHRLWPRLTGIGNSIVNYLIHMVFATIFFWGAFYAVNAVFTRGEAYTEKVIVDHRYTETRYRSRRVGRRSYARGAPYKTYHIETRFPDGRIRNLEITGGRYRDLRSGDTITLTIRRGFFGVPVADLNFEVPERPHCGSVGRKRPHRRPS